jgi:hypothetical protein
MKTTWRLLVPCVLLVGFGAHSNLTVPGRLQAESAPLAPGEEEATKYLQSIEFVTVTS